MGFLAGALLALLGFITIVDSSIANVPGVKPSTAVCVLIVLLASLFSLWGGWTW